MVTMPPQPLTGRALPSQQSRNPVWSQLKSRLSAEAHD
jgi:hypothetical protein